MNKNFDFTRAYSETTDNRCGDARDYLIQVTRETDGDRVSSNGTGLSARAIVLRLAVAAAETGV